MDLPFGSCALGCGPSFLDEGLCLACHRTLEAEIGRFSAFVRCDTCGAPLLYRGASCTHGKHPCRIIRLGADRGVLGIVLKRYEAGRKELALPLSGFLHRALASQLPGAPGQIALVPVPSDAGTIGRHGWDCMGFLVRMMASRFGYLRCKSVDPPSPMVRMRMQGGSKKARMPLRRTDSTATDVPGAVGTVVVLGARWEDGTALERCMRSTFGSAVWEVWGLCVADGLTLCGK